MSLLRSWIKSFLLKRNIVLSRPPGQFAATPLRLKRARDGGLSVKFAIDGGAANGSWTREFLEIYPGARVLCIEPRDEVQDDLKKTAVEFPTIEIAKTLVGDKVGMVEFNVDNDQSSIFSKHDQAAGKRVVENITTIDTLIAERKLPWPDLIKLDLQGAELNALSGASECLKHAQAVMLEVSFIPLLKGWPLIGDVIPFMLERGFVCYDISSLWQRPLDGALAQGDFIFLRKDHELLTDHRWTKEGNWG